MNLTEEERVAHRKASQQKYDRRVRGYRGPLTHCKNGHELTPENVYTPPGTNKRRCRKCACEISKRSHRKNAIERNARHRERRRNGHRSPSDTVEGRRKGNLSYIGWTVELFDSRVLEQEGKCAICKKALTFEMRISGSRACADHEHSEPPKPRGVLCANCNLGIGNLQDDPEIMRAAIAYVEKYK